MEDLDIKSVPEGFDCISCNLYQKIVDWFTEYMYFDWVKLENCNFQINARHNTNKKDKTN